MGRALEMLCAKAVAPGGSFVNATMLAGNSNVIRNSRATIKLLAMWDTRQSRGATRITSPMLHDSSVGILGVSAGFLGGINSGQATRIFAPDQELFSQDTLTIAMSGSSTAGDIEHTGLLVEYNDLPGIDGRFISPAQLRSKAVNHVSIDYFLSTAATGEYSGEVALNSGTDFFKANTDYAIVGYQSYNENVIHGVRFLGPDWGSLGVGGPGGLPIEINTTDWFIKMGRIPVFNSSNKELTFLDTVCDENISNPAVAVFFVELK